MPAVFAGVVRSVGGDAVDGHEGSVEDQVGHALLLRVVECLVQLGCASSQQFHGFVHMAPAGRGRHREPGGDLGKRFAFAQVDEHQ